MTEHRCQDALAELYRYLDGDLDPDELRHIEAHLRECAPCLEAFDFETELRKVVAKGCRVSAPDALVQRIMAAIKHCDGEPAPDVAGPDASTQD